MSIDVEVIENQPKVLGRNKVHDERSRSFAASVSIDRESWRDKAIRVYDPLPNPNQQVGCCTGVAKCTQMNAVGNRKMGEVLNMATALAIYKRNTEIDPFPGTWPPTDTGSSGLASCKSAIEQGIGGEYRWLFGGADEIVQSVMDGTVVSVGTWWYSDMFGSSGATHAGLTLVTPTGARVGGHQYAIRGYDKSRDLVLARCWWGEFRDFWIARTDLDALVGDGGDAHVQRRA